MCSGYVLGCAKHLVTFTRFYDVTNIEFSTVTVLNCVSVMAVFRLRILLKRRNYSVTIRKLYSTHCLPQSQARSQEMAKEVKAPNFNKEFKGMKAEFPCVTR